MSVLRESIILVLQCRGRSFGRGTLAQIAFLHPHVPNPHEKSIHIIWNTTKIPPMSVRQDLMGNLERQHIIRYLSF